MKRRRRAANPNPSTRVRNPNACQLCCGRGGDGVVSLCGLRICQACLDRIREIAIDAGVVVDEGLLGGGLRKLTRRQLTKAERKLDDALERRAIAAARRSA